MTDAERQRLAAILGMLGSEHAGERAAAGLQAEAFRKKHGLAWDQLLAERVIYVDRETPLKTDRIVEKVVYVDRPVAIYKEPSPLLDRLLIIAVFVGVPSGVLA
jgi:hypothetical protein